MKRNNESKYEQSQQAVQLSVWENGTERGKFYYKVTVLRRHKFDDDDSTKTTSYTGLTNKILLSEMIQMARGWLQKESPMQAREV